MITSLKFDNHIANICKNASKQLQVLKRIGKQLNKLDRLTIYHSFILSDFNHCSVTFHFCSEVKTNSMETFRKGPLNSSVTTILALIRSWKSNQWNQGYSDNERVIKGTQVIAVIKIMWSRDKDQTWKTDIHNKKHEVT